MNENETKYKQNKQSIMKKVLFFAAVAALTLASCAKIAPVEVLEEDVAIGFSAYSGNAVTKAGTAGEMTTTSLQSTGFGVFAYQTTGDYSSSATPNFMYNTKVSTSAWTYSPIKYWPNQIQAGNTDSQPATAYQADKVSFFAYAPHVAATASTGAVTGGTDEGITALTSNDTAGDPKVTYKVSADLDKQVDLLWAVSNGATWTNVAGTTNTPTSGKPYLNLQKPKIGTAIHFYFKHALAQINLQAVAAYNQVAAGGTAQNGVKITISEVVLSVPGMTQTATLNLNNTTANAPLWENASGSTDLTLTVTGNNLNPDLKDGGAKKAAQQPDGVTDTPDDVIVDGKYYTIIPKTGSDVTVNVKVTYYVTTDDTDLKDGYSRVENVISKDVTFTGGFAAGTKNTIKMILGISEVKFEAEVSDWADGTSADINLPINGSNS